MGTAGFIQPTAICRHEKGDPACSSSGGGYSSYETVTTSNSPDANNYKVDDAVQVGQHLVMKVRYPNCARCAYEGVKVLVYLNTSALAALKWKKIDPHFALPPKLQAPWEAPSPAARFPASPEGWQDAIEYAKRK